MASFDVYSPSGRGSSVLCRRGLVFAGALTSLLAACAGADANRFDGSEERAAAEIEAELSAAKRPPARDYTPSELEALAESEEVSKLNEPFGQNVPVPNRSLHVPGAGGTRIALDLYFPSGVEPAGTHPTAYVETWYTRTVEARNTAIDLYRAAGFVVAIADPRGFGASFGSQTGFLGPEVRADERAVIAWLAAQPWSDGNVVAVGHSISATQAEAVAATGAPSLRAAIIRHSDFDQYAQNMFPGGLPNTRMMGLVDVVLTWMRGDACVQDLAACPFVQLQPVEGDADFTLLQSALREHQANVAPNILSTLTYRDDAIGTGDIDAMSPSGNIEAMRRARIPARVTASWTDGITAQSALDRYAALPDVPMEVVINATVHSGGVSADPFTAQPFQPAWPSAEQQYSADVAFVQRVLAGEEIRRSIRYYVLGAKLWKSTTEFPPPGVRWQNLALSPGKLVSNARVVPRERGYTVDPTTSSGLYTRWASQGGGLVYYGDRRNAPGQRISFDGAMIERDSELVGAPELCLALRSDQTDGAVFAYLEDVAPDGRVTYLTEGALRLIHRKSGAGKGSCDSAPGTERSFTRADARPVVPGELMQVEIPLQPTAALLRKGHHLRLSLAGADADSFPLLSAAPATWSVAFGGRHGSTLSVPMKAWSKR